MQDSLSLYIHVPFCRHRCAYCDFNTFAGISTLIPDYVEAVCAEINGVAERVPERMRAHTIFFGGGTPSLLSSAQVEKILSACGRGFDLAEDAEITLEANPGTVSKSWLQKVHQLGVNRMSFGMQSAHPVDLRVLEREHDALDVIHSVEWSRETGFDNISLDLIFGIPGQTLERWIGSLDFALRLKPEHLSLYGLTIEPGTPFEHWIGRGLLEQPDDDLAADMFDYACQRLEEAGFVHYEISNWERVDSRGAWYCKHNLQYWQMGAYLGFGAGAHGFAGGIRTANVRGVRPYIRRIQTGEWTNYPTSPAAESILEIDRWTEMQEMMMVSLRLLEKGVDADEFEVRFGVRLHNTFTKQIDSLIDTGLLEWTQGERNAIRLTRRGWLLGNRVFREFIGLPEPRWVV